MAEYKVPLKDMSFLLYEVFKADEMWQKLPKLAQQVDKDTAQAILQECAKIAEQELEEEENPESGLRSALKKFIG